jgi:multidrug efflux pump subunit AcrA (membrane-fusion protein)
MDCRLFLLFALSLVTHCTLPQVVDGQPPESRPGRFQLVRATDEEVVLLDTTTGKLYRATPKEYLPFAELVVPKRAEKPSRKGADLQFEGQVKPVHQITIRPEWNTGIQEVLTTAGKKVKKDDLIARTTSGDSLHSPRDGIVITQTLKEGYYAGPAWEAVCTVADLTTFTIDLTVPERDLPHLKEGKPCRVMPDVFRDHEPYRKLHPDGHEGTVTQMAAVVDPRNRTIALRVKVTVPPGEEGVFLRPNMSVIVTFKKVGK